MELLSSHLCKASDLGINDNLFGGKMMSWLDCAGAILAAQACGTSKMVTLKFNEIVFHKPVKENHIVKIYGEVEKIGNTSITLRLLAKRYDIYNGDEDEVCTTKVIFVRITNEGRKRAIDLEVKNKYAHLNK